MCAALIHGWINTVAMCLLDVLRHCVPFVQLYANLVARNGKADTPAAGIEAIHAFGADTLEVVDARNKSGYDDLLDFPE